jgi:hypothetical protein
LLEEWNAEARRAAISQRVRSIEVAPGEVAGDACERGTAGDVTRTAAVAALSMEEGAAHATPEHADVGHDGATRHSTLLGSIRLDLRDERERRRQEHGWKDAASAHDECGGDRGFRGERWRRRDT